jgi:hypothetical protein
MRTWLALASLTLLIGAGFGCGDDTTSGAGMDMSMGHDMTASLVDMQKLTCAQILSCAQACGANVTCAGACVTNGSTAAQGKFGAFSACVLQVCGPGDGGMNKCPIPPDNSTSCQQCLTSTAQGAALGGTCSTQFMDCAMN